MRRDVLWIMHRLPWLRSWLSPVLILNLMYVLLAVDAIVAAIALFKLFQ